MSALPGGRGSVSKRQYRPLRPIARSDAMQMLASGDTGAVPSVLFRLAEFDPDWVWVRDLCVGYLSSNDSWIRFAAVECLGDLAKAHPGDHWIDYLAPVKRLTRASDESVASSARGALELMQRASVRRPDGEGRG